VTDLSILLSASIRLHSHLLQSHWKGQALQGPDPGVRFNYRFGRFVKSYLGFVRWRDEYCYMQAQGYWILSNWRLFRATGAAEYRDIALRCSDYIVRQQRPDGGWNYPNPAWRGRVATAEGTWAALGLVESYRQAGGPGYLHSALRWHRFLLHEVGFQNAGPGLAVNYFAGRVTRKVSNNSAMVLRFLAELADLTSEQRHVDLCRRLIEFLQEAQSPTGEFPYSVADGSIHQHFQCFQYNAFQCLDLMRSWELIRERAVVPLVRAMLSFLAGGLAEDGHAPYECGSVSRTVTYHTAVMAAAFAKATEMGFSEFTIVRNRAYQWLLTAQRADGSFPHSQGDYLVLKDERSYPRYLAMVLFHLLEPLEAAGISRPVREWQTCESA
jgi:prenyltransferase beta subunit